MEKMPFRLENISSPQYAPTLSLRLDSQVLQIADVGDISEDTEIGHITPAIGIATVLYNWCPDALWAFTDTDSWLSMTWNITLHHGQPDRAKFEIGRIRSQVTMGKLDDEGRWEVMITYDMADDGGAWIANTEETMIAEDNVEDVGKVDKIAGSFVRELLLSRPWAAGPKTKHQFFIEPVDATMDPFEDGLAIDPRWLYRSLDLEKCTACELQGSPGLSLSRCGRCGTAAYCSSACQRKDWSIHRSICTVSAIDRGKALHLSSRGGLVKYDWSQGVNIVEVDEGIADA